MATNRSEARPSDDAPFLRAGSLLDKGFLLEQLGDVLEASPDIILMSEPDLRLVYANRSARLVLGISENDLTSRTLRDYHVSWAIDLLADVGIPAAVAGGSWIGEGVVISAEGQQIQVLETVIAHRDLGGNLRHLSVVAHDITPERQLDSEAREFAAIVENSSDAILAKALDGKITSWNAGAASMYGYSPQEAIGQNIRLIVPEDRQDELRDILGRLAAGERIAHFRTQRRRKDGDLIWVSLTVSPLFDRDGRVVGASAIARNITEWIKAQDEIQRLNIVLGQRVSELETLLKVLPVGIGIARDPECKDIRINPAFAGLLGLTADVNASLSAPDEDRPHNFKVLADGRELTPEELPIQRAAVENREITSFEEQVVFTDGTMRHLLAYAAPLHDDRQQVRGAVGIFVDITGRKEAEAALQESEERFRQIAEALREVVWMADVDTGEMQYISPRFETTFGLPVSGAYGVPHAFLDLVHPDDRRRIETALAGQRQGFDEVFRIIRPDGMERFIHAQSYPIAEPGGAVERVVGVADDVTAAREAQMALEESQRILDALMEHVPEGIGIADAPGAVVRMVSRYGQQILGREESLLAGMDAREHPEAWDLLMRDGETRPSVEQLPLTRAVSHGEVVKDEEFLARRPDGSVVPILCNAAPIRDAGGAITGGVIAWRDITTIKSAQDRLEMAYKQEQSVSQVLQRALIPAVTEHIQGVHIAPAYQPASAEALVGGDFFDVFHPSPGLLGIAIGDVTGKGVKAAVSMGVTKHTLRAYAYEDPSPHSVVERLNNTLCRELTEDTFITLFYGLIDLAHREMSFTNAGHEPPLWLLPDEPRVVELHEPQPPIGVLPGKTYEQHRILLDSSQMLLFYTDGITEARSGDDFFGIERLKEFLLEHKGHKSETSVADLVRVVTDFCAGLPQDDIAALLVRVE